MCWCLVLVAYAVQLCLIDLFVASVTILGAPFACVALLGPLCIFALAVLS